MNSHSLITVQIGSTANNTAAHLWNSHLATSSCSSIDSACPFTANVNGKVAVRNVVVDDFDFSNVAAVPGGASVDSTGSSSSHKAEVVKRDIDTPSWLSLCDSRALSERTYVNSKLDKLHGSVVDPLAMSRDSIDDFEDAIRLQCERSDRLDGFLFMCDTSDKFVHCSSQALQLLLDEYARNSKLCLPLYSSSSFKDLSLARPMSQCDLISSMCCETSLTLPLGLMTDKADQLRDFPRLTYDLRDTNATCAITASYLQTLLASCCQDNMRLPDLLCSHVRGSQRLATASLTLPFTVNSGVCSDFVANCTRSIHDGLFNTVPLTPFVRTQQPSVSRLAKMQSTAVYSAFVSGLSNIHVNIPSEMQNYYNKFDSFSSMLLAKSELDRTNLSNVYCLAEPLKLQTKTFPLEILSIPPAVQSEISEVCLSAFCMLESSALCGDFLKRLESDLRGSPDMNLNREACLETLESLNSLIEAYRVDEEFASLDSD